MYWASRLVSYFSNIKLQCVSWWSSLISISYTHIDSVLSRKHPALTLQGMNGGYLLHSPLEEHKRKKKETWNKKLPLPKITDGQIFTQFRLLQCCLYTSLYHPRIWTNMSLIATMSSILLKFTPLCISAISLTAVELALACTGINKSRVKPINFSLMLFSLKTNPDHSH